MSKFYIVKHNSKVFEPNTLVKCDVCSDSGNCYLIVDLKDDGKREWIMYYDLYPLSLKKEDYSRRWYYNDEYHSIGLELLKNHLT
jgi:hypothetical protein